MGPKQIASISKNDNQICNSLKNKKAVNANASAEHAPRMCLDDASRAPIGLGLGIEEEMSETTSTHPPSGGRRADALHRAVETWNAVCGPLLSRVAKLTPSREAKLGRRLREDFGNDLDCWANHCRRIVASPFLTGATGGDWRADFDWALKPDNVAKVVEGRYDPREPVQPVSQLRGGL